MIRSYVKTFFFLSSYSPLFLILLIRNYTNLYAVITFSTLILIPNVFFIYVIKKSSKMSGDYISISSAENKSNQFLEYIIAYIIPFLGFSFLEILDILTLLILFLVVGVLYVRSDLIYMNPTLNILFKYQLYKCENGKESFLVLSKNKLENIKKVRIFWISEYFGVRIQNDAE